MTGYTHTWPASRPGVSKGHWPPLGSTSCVLSTRVPRGNTLSWQQPSSLSFDHPPHPPVNVLPSFLTRGISSSFIHFRASQMFAVKGDTQIRDGIYFKSYRKRPILKFLMMFLTYRNSIYKLGEQHYNVNGTHNVEWLQHHLWKHHPCFELLSGPLHCLRWGLGRQWGFLGVL